MSLINVNHLTFAYEGSYDTIFENVSFQMDTDWKLGFTGRNGRGKTTFLNLLLGKYPYEGQISAKVDFDYFPFSVPVGSADVMTLDVIDGILPDYEYWKLSRELNYLEISDEILYRPYTALSGGEKSKVQLAALFLKEGSFLLIDEPTNHLDMHGRETLARYLQKKRGFILVSHDRLFLDACVDHILSINKTNIEIQKGNFSSWLHNKELQDHFELAENQKLNRQIKSMEAAARRTAAWSDTIEKRKTGGTGGQAGVKPDKGHIGAQAAKMMKRSKAAAARKEAAITSKASLLKNIERADDLKIHPLSYHTDVLVAFDNVSGFYRTVRSERGDGEASGSAATPGNAAEISGNAAEFSGNAVEFPVFNKKSFTVKRGDRIALQGSNGCGKSSILKLILQAAGKSCTAAGSADWAAAAWTPANSTDEAATSANSPVYSVLPEFTGNLRVGSGLKISYVPQSTEGLSGALDDYATGRGIDITLLKTILRKLDFSRLQFEKKIEDYSEGQKKKVLLAASLCESAHLYIWDEPLNYIDVLSRMQIENLLLQFHPTMIFVEHDKAFCDNVATETVLL